jgi:hypothetical protein
MATVRGCRDPNVSLRSCSVRPGKGRFAVRIPNDLPLKLGPRRYLDRPHELPGSILDEGAINAMLAWPHPRVGRCELVGGRVIEGGETKTEGCVKANRCGGWLWRRIRDWCGALRCALS